MYREKLSRNANVNGECFTPGLFDVDSESEKRRTHGEPKKHLDDSVRKHSLLDSRDYLLPEAIRRQENGKIEIDERTPPPQSKQARALFEAAGKLSSIDNVCGHNQHNMQARRCGKRKQETTSTKNCPTQEQAEFQFGVSRELLRKRRSLERKANRTALCSNIGRPMNCLGCGRKVYLKWFCGLRYCRNCAYRAAWRLYAQYSKLQPLVEGVICPKGFRPRGVLVRFTITTKNLGRISTTEEVRQFNRDVRKTFRKICRQLSIPESDVGVLWCNEFGGPGEDLKAGTNLHCHGLWVGPRITEALLSSAWSRVRGNGDYRVEIKPVRGSKGKPDFLFALRYVFFYTAKHISKYRPEGLATFEMVFTGIRRVHAMGRFYNAPETRKCPAPSATPLCPVCKNHLAYTRPSGLRFVKDLEKEGRINLDVHEGDRESLGDSGAVSMKHL